MLTVTDQQALPRRAHTTPQVRRADAAAVLLDRDRRQYVRRVQPPR